MRALRYFIMLRLHPAYALALLAGVTTVGAWAMWVSPDELDTGLGLLLVMQMFLASTAFVSRAHRGHFDPLLSGARPRAGIAAAHCAASILPVVVCWLGLAIGGVALGSSAAVSALAGRRAAAMAIVSAVAWSAGFALPRGGAGLAWIALLTTILLNRIDLLRAVSAGSPSTLLRSAAVALVCPFVLVGRTPLLDASAIAVAVSAAAAIVACTCRMAVALDVFLEER